MNREAMKHDRDCLLTAIKAHEESLELRKRVLAELDRQLAAPPLPEGWTAASERLPPDAVSVLVLHSLDATLPPTSGCVAIAFYGTNDGTWNWPAPWAGDIGDEVLAWRDIPADWLRPAEAKPAYPRYFRHVAYFVNDVVYIRYGIDGQGAVRADGSVGTCIHTIADAERFVRDGDWLEITAAEAEAMVQPTIRESRKVEPTTERMIDVLNACWWKASTSDGEAKVLDAISRRVEAYDRLIDPATLWEEPREKHKHGEKCWVAKIRFDGDCIKLRCVVWIRGVWTYAGIPDRPLPEHVTILALADPAKLIGGGE